MRILSVTTQRNEGPFLLEWLAWHRLLGVTDFLVYSNDCTDGSDALLDALAGHGVLRHQPNTAPPGKSVQWTALKRAWQDPLRKAADWMLVSDIDEFPVIHAGAGRLGDLMAAIPADADADAVALPWRLFGSGGITGFEDRPVIQQFTRAAPPDLVYPIGATLFKSLFRPVAFARPGVHRPRNRAEGGAKWASGSGGLVGGSFAANDQNIWVLNQPDARALAEMHHYSLRSAESFLLKSERGLPNRRDRPIDSGYWIERNFNTVENLAAHRLLPELLAGIDALKSLPGIAARHQASVDWHRARLAELLRDRPNIAFYAQLLMSPDTRPLPLDQQHRLLRRMSGAGNRGRPAFPLASRAVKG
ncbi:MAG: glycosyltransferase family 2 protein [Paracoccus sp. (in: a-proteobacteria)]|nr:glycosyltransferase family 2 protein [Paracoccus sp. (in: a-proteobacteria)]